MAEGGSGASPESAPGPSGPPPPASRPASRSPLSPPKAEVDDSPLQKSMDKNKESLKVKLMLRRPINQLVAQGIMPPLKTPPAFHEQRQKLERAKMGDLLKAKIQQRPDRQELVRQHILEDVGHVDPSLAERQRMLKKARLADSLNDQLSHRPGPLELIKKNILHTDEPIERAIKEGVIPFKATSEGQVTKPQHPNRYITFEEDSQSSEGAQSPLPTQPPVTTTPEVRSRPDVLEAAAASAGIVTVAINIPTARSAVVATTATPTLQQQCVTSSPTSSSRVCTPLVESQPAQPMIYADLCGLNSVVGSVSHSLAPASSPMSLGSTTSSLSPLSSISISSPPAPSTPSPRVTITPKPQSSPITAIPSPRSDAPGKDKNRKKSKSKTQPKTRTIKFHEYKGPPNAHKSTSINSSPVETSYELLLQQQQLFLQWQLEWQHKYPQIILPASQKPLTVSSDQGNGLQAALPAVPNRMAVASSATAQLSHSPVITTTNIVQPATPTLAVQCSVPQPSTSTPSQEMSITQSLPAGKTLAKLEDMKVSDLKAELKRRNLPVSGSKPQLIERLKPFSDPAHQQNSQNNEISQISTIPISHMEHTITDVQNTVVKEESLSSFSVETPVSPTMQQMPLTVESSTVEDDASLPNLSPYSEQQQQLSIFSPTMSPDGTTDMEMDISDDNFSTSTLKSSEVQILSPQPASPTLRQSPMSQEIIRDQQRKIEELQRELLRSQLQLQKIRYKELNPCTLVSQAAQKPDSQDKLQASEITVNADIINSNNAYKQHQKLILQQHLQQKKQQQQLHQQIQAFQMQNLAKLQESQQSMQDQHVKFQEQQKQQNQFQKNQLQQQSIQESQEKQKCQPQSPQTSQQLSHGSLNSKQILGTNARYSALHKKQGPQNLQITKLLPQQTVLCNNKNNTCILSNNKNMAVKSVVLGQHQAARVLNEMNIKEEKPGVLKNVVGHQRTSSLPNFFGSFLGQQQSQAQAFAQTSESSAENEESPAENSESDIFIAKQLPQYEELTKQLKVKQEIPSEAVPKTNTWPKNVKSQMMDDVLEILIKNGELPPSAAQDPAIPVTLVQSLPHTVVLTTSTSVSPVTASTSTVNSPLKSEATPPPIPPPPPPPPPPPLPHTTFAITLPTSITLTSQQDSHESNSHESNPFQMQFTEPDTLEFLLDNTETRTNMKSLTQETYPGIVPSNLPTAAGIDLKELGLDLETLDSVDFDHFGDLCRPVKMPSSNLLDTVSDMEIGGSGVPANDINPKEEMLQDQFMNQAPCELDIGELPMDMDDADWLESLMLTDQNAKGNMDHTSDMVPPLQNAFSIPSSENSFSPHHFNHSHVDLDSYDPLLSNSQDPFEIFNIEDPDFKMSADLNSMGWDKVDYTT